MDRDRLKEIQTADLSESNVNEEFVHWLKTKAPSYLLIIMVVIVTYLFVVQYKNKQFQHRSEAWAEYLEAKASGLPASHEDVAQTYADIDSIGVLSLLNAADIYLQSILTGTTVGNDTNITSTLTEEDRVFYLSKADDLYSKVVDLNGNDSASTLLVISGLNGRAAVAEARGDIDAARGFYESVASRIGDQYPALAGQAQKRIETLASLTEMIVLPSDAEVTARNSQETPREPVSTNSTIDSLIDPIDLGSN